MRCSCGLILIELSKTTGYCVGCKKKYFYFVCSLDKLDRIKLKKLKI